MGRGRRPTGSRTITARRDTGGSGLPPGMPALTVLDQPERVTAADVHPGDRVTRGDADSAFNVLGVERRRGRIVLTHDGGTTGLSPDSYVDRTVRGPDPDLYSEEDYPSPPPPDAVRDAFARAGVVDEREPVSVEQFLTELPDDTDWEVTMLDSLGRRRSVESFPTRNDAMEYLDDLTRESGQERSMEVTPTNTTASMTEAGDTYLEDKYGDKALRRRAKTLGIDAATANRVITKARAAAQERLERVRSGEVDGSNSARFRMAATRQALQDEGVSGAEREKIRQIANGAAVAASLEAERHEAGIAPGDRSVWELRRWENGQPRETLPYGVRENAERYRSEWQGMGSVNDVNRRTELHVIDASDVEEG